MLCGYIGPKDESVLTGMERELDHRVRSGWTRLDAGNLSLSWGNEAQLRPLNGAYSDGHTTLAIVGMPNHPSIEEFNSLFKRVKDQGPNALDQLGGSYVGLFRTPDTCFLFRDQAGRRTIYQTRIKGNLHFAVESRALYRLPAFRPRISAASLAQYLSFSYTPGIHTMLEDIYELPAGSRWYTSEHQPTRVFTPELEEQSIKSENEWVDEFNERYHLAISNMDPGVTDRPLFLSGGLDSSLVAASLTELYGASHVSAYVAHFGKDYPNELPYARDVASHLGIHCEEVQIQPKDFVPILPEMVQKLNDPIGDPVTMPNYLLAKHVSQQGGSFVYNGEGGDPLFGGPKNLGMLLHNWYGGSHQHNHQEKSYLSSYRRAYEERSFLLSDKWLKSIDEGRDLEGVLTPFFSAQHPTSFLKKLLIINMRLKGAHLILPKVERMLGAHGIVPLSPLYDESLIRLTLQLPPALLLKYGQDKQILKRAAQGRIPDHIIHRPKSGMRVPVHYWFKGEMRRYARHILLDKKTKNAGIFNYSRIKQLLNYDTEEGIGRYGIRLWMLLTFELWRRDVFQEH